MTTIERIKRRITVLQAIVDVARPVIAVHDKQKWMLESRDSLEEVTLSAARLVLRGAHDDDRAAIEAEFFGGKP